MRWCRNWPTETGFERSLITRIDNISLDFTVQDEAFARSLYADWDSFCRSSVIDIADGFFARYDSKDTYLEIDRLDLDLGDIPQERFQELFPVRFREALERSFNRRWTEMEAHEGTEFHAGTSPFTDQPSLQVRQKRFENLIHYLEHGFCLPEWDVQEFSLDEELRLFCADAEHAEQLLSLFVVKPHTLERLFRQSDVRRWVEVMTATPGVDRLAGSLTDGQVRLLMAAALQGRAGSDLPDYWYRLYHVLLETSSFAGAPVSGDRQRFRMHLNSGLLSFLRKDAGQEALSKPDLTLRFLSEAFGETHGLAVLDTLFRSRWFEREGITLQDILQVLGGSLTSASTLPSVMADALAGQADSFIRWLEDPEIPTGVKQMTLLQEVRNHPGRVVRWLKSGPDKRQLSLFASLMDGWTLSLLAGFVSPQLAEAVSVLSEAAEKAAASVPWLRSMDWSKLAETLDRVVLQGIALDRFSASEPVPGLVRRLTGMLYQEITGREVPEKDVFFEAVQSAGHPFPEAGQLAGWLMSPSVSSGEKERLLQHQARIHPEQLWEFIRQASAGIPGQAAVRIEQWGEWVPADTWLAMMSGVSQTLAETLRRASGFIGEKVGWSESTLSESLVRLVAGYPAERFRTADASAVVREYLALLAKASGKDSIPSSAAVMEALHLADAGQVVEEIGQAAEDEVRPEVIYVPNAGLCLLSVWFPRLFRMLDLLTEDGKGFRDMESRIRAVFILQRLVTGEFREYREQELAFNRILTGCPFYVPLPKTLTLAEQEIRTVESMLSGVKANWDKLKNTSVKGFQTSFIARPGRLERRADKWVLYVENRAYDILLDSLPWSYRQIRLPWLKERITVVWRNKDEFDFDI